MTAAGVANTTRGGQDRFDAVGISIIVGLLTWALVYATQPLAIQSVRCEATPIYEGDVAVGLHLRVQVRFSRPATALRARWDVGDRVGQELPLPTSSAPATILELAPPEGRLLWFGTGLDRACRQIGVDGDVVLQRPLSRATMDSLVRDIQATTILTLAWEEDSDQRLRRYNAPR